MSRKSLSLRASAIKSMPWFHAVFVESKVLLQGAQFFQLEFDRILLCQNLGRVLERSIYDEGLSELCFEAPTMWHARLFSWKPKWKKPSCIPWDLRPGACRKVTKTNCRNCRRAKPFLRTAWMALKFDADRCMARSCASMPSTSRVP